MKAKNREEFISCWEEEFDILAMLSERLPTNSALEYLNKLRELRLRYIALAANETYGLQFCRHCEHMKDHANGKTGCGYEWAIWKLGVSRSYDPTKERNIYTNNPFPAEQPQKPINWNEPHATAKLLKRYGPTAEAPRVTQKTVTDALMKRRRFPPRSTEQDPTLNPKFLKGMEKADPL